MVWDILCSKTIEDDTGALCRIGMGVAYRALESCMKIDAIAFPTASGRLSFCL